MSERTGGARSGRRVGRATGGDLRHPLDVWMVVEVVRANGGIEGAAHYLEVPAHWIEAAARYYAAYPDEIDGEIRQNDEYAEREMQLDAERHRLLG